MTIEINTSASIVLYKNNPDDISSLVNSIIESTAIRRLYLIDNGNCSWAQSYSTKSRKVEYIKTGKNIGFGRAHNIAIEKEIDVSDFFLVLNPDIEVKSTDLDFFIKTAGQINADLFMPDIVYPNNQRQYLCKLLPTPLTLISRRFLPFFHKKYISSYELHDADYTNHFFVPYLSGCFMLIRSSALKEIGLFDERYFLYMEDTDLSRRISANGEAIFLPSIKVIHRYQKSSYKSIKLLFIHSISAIKYFNKWGWFFDNKRALLNRKCIESLQKNKAHH